MYDAEYFINKIMEHYKINTISELAKHIGISQPSISAWKKNNYITAIKKKCRELEIYDQIFGNIQSLDITHRESDKIDNYVADLRLIFSEDELEVELKKMLVEKILSKFKNLQSVFQKIVTLSWGYDRPYLFMYYIFQMIESEMKKAPKINSYQEFLQSVVANFKVYSMANSPAFTEIIKKEMIENIEFLLSEEECKIIINEYQLSIDVIESSMSLPLLKFHKNAFKK